MRGPLTSSRIVSVFVLFFALLLMAAPRAAAQTLTGRVLDDSHHPVAHATVLVLRRTTVIATATTDRDGRFGPLTLAPGAYDVLVATAGLRSDPAPVTIASDQAATVDLTATRSAASDSVVVSASEVPTTLSHATGSVTTIDRADLDLQQTHGVADALRFVPGLSVAASGTPGGVTSVFPRGGESNYTLVLVDGIPQNSFGGAFDFAHLDTSDIERIEVVGGADSALFGSGAIGGVVDIITRQGGPARGTFATEGGGYGEFDTNASASGSRGAWRFGASFDRDATNGDTRTFASIGGPVSNDDYTHDNGSVSVGWSDRATRLIRLDVRDSRAVRGEPGPYGSDPEHLFGGLDTISRDWTYTREVGLTAIFGDGTPVRQAIEATWADLSSHAVSPFGPFDDATRRETGRYQADFGGRRLGLSAGAELLREQANDTFVTGSASEPIPVIRLDTDGFIEARPSVGARGTVTLGARVERMQRDALEGDAFGSRPPFANDVEWSFNPKAAASWFLTDPQSTHWTKVLAGAGTGTRPPDVFELAFTNNPDLKPERSRSVDGGVEQALAVRSLVIDATAFDNRYTDLIVTVGSSFTGASRYTSDNIANAASHGLEVGASWQGPHGLRARGAVTFLHTEVLGVNGFPTTAPLGYETVGGPLVRRPARQGSAVLEWAGRRGSAFISVNGRGAMADLEPNLASDVFTNPGYAVVTLGGSVRIAKGFELYGRIDNAFNRAYEEIYGFPALGRAAVGGLRVAGSR